MFSTNRFDLTIPVPAVVAVTVASVHGQVHHYTAHYQ
jgi:hypothetical protein